MWCSKFSINLSFWISCSPPFVNCRAPVETYGARVNMLWNCNAFCHIHYPVWFKDPQIARTKHVKLIWNTFALKPWFFPSGPSEQMMKESASHHIYQRSPPQRPEDNLYEYCALAQQICGFWGWFCGFLWLRGNVFWTSPSLRIGSFLMELRWSGKLPAPSWNHIGSSWIISEIFKFFHKFVILNTIFTTFF